MTEVPADHVDRLKTAYDLAASELQTDGGIGPNAVLFGDDTLIIIRPENMNNGNEKDEFASSIRMAAVAKRADWVILTLEAWALNIDHTDEAALAEYREYRKIHGSNIEDHPNRIEVVTLHVESDAGTSMLSTLIKRDEAGTPTLDPFNVTNATFMPREGDDSGHKVTGRFIGFLPPKHIRDNEFMREIAEKFMEPSIVAKGNVADLEARIKRSMN